MSSRTNLRICLTMLMLLAVMVSPAIGKIIFVDINAGGKDNGSSWVDAFKHLQDALAAAKDGDRVWVASGVYRPDRGSKNPGGSGDRTSTFRLENGVGIYGGFKSGGCAWERRDPDAYPTVLSGDLSCNDGPGEPFVPRERHVLDNRGSMYVDNLFTFAEGFDAFNFKADREEAQ